MMPDLFADVGSWPPRHEPIAEGAALLRAWALPMETEILTALAAVIDAAPFRHMVTPGGFAMSVAMTNCGTVGWGTDRTGYRYDRADPLTGRPWPAMPASFRELATGAAAAAGYHGYAPDACLINRYAPGSRLSAHQDRNERDFSQPIVSVCLGLPAMFLFGGLRRGDPMTRHGLCHGDVVVWGAASRLAYHGIAALKDGEHPKLGRARVNLTFRRAL